MKITIAQLLEKKESLDKVLKKDLPFKLSYRLSKLASTITQESKQIEKTRNEMIKKFGEEEKEKGGYVIPKEKIEEFQKEWESFVKEEIKVKIDLIPFETMELVELSAYDVSNIIDFVEPEKKNKEK